MQRPYIDLVGGSEQVYVKEVNWATNAQRAVPSQKVTKTKIRAVLTVSSRSPLLALAGDRILRWEQTDCRSNTGWVLLSLIHGSRPHSIFTCNVTTQGDAQSKT